MHVCFLEPYCDSAGETPDAFLDRTILLRGLPRAMTARGHRVDVVVQWPDRARIDAGGVRYHFLPAGRLVRRIARMAARGLGRPAAGLTPALAAIRTAYDLAPDVLHVHGTQLHLNLALLRLLRPRRAPITVFQYHGGHPSSWPLVRRLQRFNLAGAAGFCVTAPEQAALFQAAQILPAAAPVAVVAETSTPFRFRPRADARRQTKMTGDPVVVWTGRLDPVKDPMTALRGFERVLAARPAAHLYLYYRSATLLPELRRFVEARPALRAHVHFRGEAPHAAIEAVYNSADVLLQASRREYSGYAVLEALACGVLPVVTDIPAFRALTADGRHGVLFPPGDPDALCRGLLGALAGDLAARADAARVYFETELSFPALARRFEAVYADALAARRRSPVASVSAR